MAADNGKLEGYVKPIIQNLQVLDWEKEEESFLNKVWQGIVEGITQIFNNKEKDQIATKTPISGDLNNLDVGVWPTVWNIFKNAFIEALSKQVEGTIDFESGRKEEK